MDRRTKLGIGGAAAVVAIGAGSFLGIAAATGGDDDEPLQGDAKDRAVAAALASTGGGTVTETEAGDDGAAYDVEVRKADGSQVEVQLDADFHVIGSAVDDDGSGGEGRRLAGRARAARACENPARADHLRHRAPEPRPRLDRLGHRLRRAEGAARPGRALRRRRGWAR